MKAALNLLYPPQCLLCDALVEEGGMLCGTCWGETPFVTGLVCDCCGVPLPGTEASDALIHCDACTAARRPWSRGRSAVLYAGKGRALVLALKHGDRQDLVGPASAWMARAAAPVLQNDFLVAPVPIHWRRMVRRRYNQAALLARALAYRTGLAYCSDLLQRHKATRMLDGLGRAERAATLADAIGVHARHRGLMASRKVLLVDDVLTSGATLTACAEACRAAGAQDVRVVTLARVATEA